MRRISGEGTVRKRPDGRWEARVRLPDGRRRSVFAKTAAEANEGRLALLDALRRGLPVPAERLTVAEFLATWLEGRRPVLRPATWACYEGAIRLHIVPLLGHRKLAKLTPRDVQGMMASLLERGLSPRTVGLARTVLRAALEQAVRWGEIPRNPAALVSSPPLSNRPVAPWTAEECAAFIAGIRGDRLEALYICALTLGLRQGELVGLSWADVELERGEVRVVQARDRHTGTFGPPKSRQSRRALPLTAVALDALRRHAAAQERDRELLGEEWVESGLVFTTAKGTPLDGSFVGRAFVRHTRRLGLRVIRFHDARHTAATLLLSQGVGLRTIMEWLGHSQIAITANTYSHVLPHLKLQAAAEMDAALEGGRGSRGGQIGGQLRVVGRR